MTDLNWSARAAAGAASSASASASSSSWSSSYSRPRLPLVQLEPGQIYRVLVVKVFPKPEFPKDSMVYATLHTVTSNQRVQLPPLFRENNMRIKPADVEQLCLEHRVTLGSPEMREKLKSKRFYIRYIGLNKDAGRLRTTRRGVDQTNGTEIQRSQADEFDSGEEEEKRAPAPLHALPVAAPSAASSSASSSSSSSSSSAQAEVGKIYLAFVDSVSKCYKYIFVKLEGGVQLPSDFPQANARFPPKELLQLCAERDVTVGTEKMKTLLGFCMRVRYTGQVEGRPRVTRILPDSEATAEAPQEEPAHVLSLRNQKRLVDSRDAPANTAVHEERMWAPLGEGDVQTCRLSTTEPKIHCSQEFDFGAADPVRLADQLVKAARGMGALLHQHPKLTKAFRLEIVPGMNYSSSSSSASSPSLLWRLHLSLHPVAWFRCAFPSEERAQGVVSARAWLECQDSHSAGHAPQEENQCIGEDLTKPDDSAWTPCKKGGACAAMPQCPYFHSDLTCVRTVARRDGPPTPCGWTALDELVLCKSDEWLLLARAAPIRDVLLLPRPPMHHYSNAELVLQPDFWMEVIRTLKQLRSAMQDSTEPLRDISGAITASHSTLANGKRRVAKSIPMRWVAMHTRISCCRCQR